jgi:hypothetical protein
MHYLSVVAVLVRFLENFECFFGFGSLFSVYACIRVRVGFGHDAFSPVLRVQLWFVVDNDFVAFQVIFRYGHLVASGRIVGGNNS